MASPPGPGLVFPEVTAPHESVSGLHETMNLPGFLARDFFAPPGTKVLAPEAGTIVRFSGRDPSEPPTSAHGAWGWSEYLQGVSGTEYFITHLGERNVREGETVVPGQIIGAVGDFPGSTPDHIHLGAHGGPYTVTDLLSGKHLDSLAAGERGTGSASGPESVDLGTAPVTKQISQAGHATVGAIKSIPDALDFIFSARFLEIVGGGILVIVGLVGLMREVGINVPNPLAVAAAATPAKAVAGPISSQPRRTQKAAGFTPASAETDRADARQARRERVDRAAAANSDDVPF